MNNLLFAAFALVVLIGTVFPLFVQAIENQQLTVGTPYYDSITVPLGFALLFFMAIGPVLPWRKGTSEVLRHRLAVPAWAAVAVLAACVIGGVRGLTPLAAFALAAFAGASAIRQLLLGVGAARRNGLGVWRGLVGRSNGGMIVHLGVVVVAVGLTAATSYGHRATFELRPRQAVTYEGHRIEYLGARPFTQPNRSGIVGTVLVDSAVFHPAISDYPGYEGIETPAVDSSVRDDVYLTISGISASGRGAASIGVVDQPLVLWLWAGGVLTAFGALMAAVPGRRRRRRPLPEVSSAEAGVEDDPGRGVSTPGVPAGVSAGHGAPAGDGGPLQEQDAAGRAVEEQDGRSVPSRVGAGARGEK